MSIRKIFTTIAIGLSLSSPAIADITDAEIKCYSDILKDIYAGEDGSFEEKVITIDYKTNEIKRVVLANGNETIWGQIFMKDSPPHIQIDTINTNNYDFKDLINHDEIQKRLPKCAPAAS